MPPKCCNTSKYVFKLYRICVHVYDVNKENILAGSSTFLISCFPLVCITHKTIVLHTLFISVNPVYKGQTGYIDFTNLLQPKCDSAMCYYCLSFHVMSVLKWLFWQWGLHGKLDPVVQCNYCSLHIHLTLCMASSQPCLCGRMTRIKPKQEFGLLFKIRKTERCVVLNNTYPPCCVMSS